MEKCEKQIDGVRDESPDLVALEASIAELLLQLKKTVSELASFLEPIGDVTDRPLIEACEKHSESIDQQIELLSGLNK